MSLKKELQRKSFHQLALLIPAVYWFSSKSFVLTLLIPVTLIIISVDLARLRFPAIGRLFNRIFGIVMRQHEYRRMTGSSYLFSGAVIVIFLFPKSHVILSLLILTISDTAAAVIGRSYGRHKFFEKSWEGSGVFLLTALLIGFALPDLHWSEAIAGAVIATFIEALPAPIDDNFSIPVGTCCALYFLFTL